MATFAMKEIGIKAGLLKESLTKVRGSGIIGANSIIIPQILKVSEYYSLLKFAESLFDHTCVIQRRTRSTDGYLGASDTWTSIQTLMVGIAPPNRAQLEQYASLIGAKTSWIVNLPETTNIQAQDHLLIDGETMIVQATLTPHSYATLKAVLATEIKQDG